MSKISYTQGDLFAAVDQFAQTKDEPSTVVIAHVCNSVGAWGAGFVVPFGRRFPASKSAYQAWFGQQSLIDTVVFPGGNTFGLDKTQLVPLVTLNLANIVAANMVAQQGTGGVRPLRYNSLAACMDQVARECLNSYRNPVIFCPMFGSGLAGGNWNFIETLIDDCWLKNGIETRVFYLEGQTPQGWNPLIS